MFLSSSDVLNLQLYLVVLEDVVLNGIGDVEGALTLDIACRSTLAKGDAINHIATLAIDKFQFDMLLLATNYLTSTIVVNTAGTE